MVLMPVDKTIGLPLERVWQSRTSSVSDADAICARARAAGAEIVFDIQDKPYGGRGFTCRDPEGHVWNVDTYDPWQAK